MKTKGFLLKYPEGKSEIGINKNQPTDSLVSTTYKELKDKRDAGKLTPGALYRITDYQCTTTQEGTQSAGHQFDIVLLALSENKLAEEGWAMMHDNIYDVTFADGTRRRCYLYLFKDDDGEQYNIVYADTLIGYTGYIEDGDIVNIDEENKTASINLIQDFEIENLTYNYFQNSNLSAWKVWYCLDNDTTRFAWAMDMQPASIENANNTQYVRKSDSDVNVDGTIYYCWYKDGVGTTYTLNETPSAGDMTYNEGKQGMEEEFEITSYTPPQEGRGVVYRLIDECGNDCPYDFKNILQKTRFTQDGEWDENAPELYCYTFSMDFDDIKDASVVSQREVIVRNNKIEGAGEILQFKHVIFAPGDYPTGLNIIGNYIDAVSEICIGLGQYSSCMGYKFTNSSGIFIVSSETSDGIITRNYAMVGAPSSVQRTQVVDDSIDLWG